MKALLYFVMFWIALVIYALALTALANSYGSWVMGAPLFFGLAVVLWKIANDIADGE